MTALSKTRGDSRTLKRLAVLVPLLILLAPLLYLAYRSLGKSLHWRFKPGLERVTEFGGMLQYPSLDKNEQRLVFEAVPERLSRIYLLDLETGVRQVISEPGFDCHGPRISADGRIVIYEKIAVRYPEKRSCLVVRDLEKGESYELGRAFSFVRSAALNRDGSRILVSGVGRGKRKIRVYDNGKRKGVELASGPSEELLPVLSEDGSAGAFLTDAGEPGSGDAGPGNSSLGGGYAGNGELGGAGTGKGKVGRASMGDGNIGIANNGNAGRESARPQVFRPCLVDFATGRMQRLREDRPCTGLSLSADGRFLAYETAGPGASKIMLLDSPGNRVAELGSGFAPVVSRDGTRVLFDTINDAYDLCLVDLQEGTRRTLERGSPYPSRTFLAADSGRLYFCSGLYNSLANTGNSDIFRIEPGRYQSGAVEKLPLQWQQARLEPAVFPRRRLRHPQKTVPRNTMWVADYYFQNDGTRKDMKDQDLDPIELYSSRVACMIDRVKRLTGSETVNLVCHCMGGLVAKGAIQFYHDGVYGFSGTDGIPACEEVNRLVVLGSPLRGISFFGLVPLMKSLNLSWWGHEGFRRQAYDMVRGSEFLYRLNLGERWQEPGLGTVAACYKPHGRENPPYYHSYTCDSYLIMDGAVEIPASRSAGLSGSLTHFPDDHFSLMYETPEGRYSFENGRGLVHVPEDIVFDFVAEDKARAVADYIRRNFEKDIPILFVHGSLLYRGLGELCWLVEMRRLAGKVEGWNRDFVYLDESPDGQGKFWLIDAGYEDRPG